jgi:hypothetical protein
MFKTVSIVISFISYFRLPESGNQNQQHHPISAAACAAISQHLLQE